MRKTAIIVAGAMAFDLGVVVVAQAQEKAGGHKHQGGNESISLNFAKIEAQHRAVDMFLKLSGPQDAKACTAHGFQVVQKDGQQQCLLPASKSAKSSAR